MDNGRQINGLISHPINHSVSIDNKFANRIIVDLNHALSDGGDVGKSVDRSEDAFGESGGISIGIPGDKPADFSQVGQSLRRPNNSEARVANCFLT
jgi:hypothetical protein